jgi:Ni/Fe-hydrogenase subunit HybB-like protein
LFVFLGSWFKRFIIVVPTMEHPFLPKQNVPLAWMHYHPTLTETSITVASLVLVLLIITLLSKFFPLVPIWEMAEDDHSKSEVNE